MNSRPCCDTVNVSTKLKTHLTTTTTSRAQTVLRMPATIHLPPAKKHISASIHVTHGNLWLLFQWVCLHITKCECMKGLQRGFHRERIQVHMGKPFNRRAVVSCYPKWGQRKHISPQSSHWPLGSFLFLSQPRWVILNTAVPCQMSHMASGEKENKTFI